MLLPGKPAATYEIAPAWLLPFLSNSVSSDISKSCIKLPQ